MAFYNLHGTPEGMTFKIFMKDLGIPLFSALVTVLFVGPAKSIGYERTDVIKDAKQEGENRIPTMAKPTP